MGKIFFTITLFFCFMEPASALEFVWPRNTPLRDDMIYYIRIGQYTRSYDQKIEVEAGESIDMKDLPLKPDAANFIAASTLINNVEIFSEEIIIIGKKEGQLDSDEDGLSDMFETVLGTDPKQADTDEDGIPDGEEFVTWGADRCLLNSDEDEFAKNILDKDSDNDGIRDGEDPSLRRYAFFSRNSGDRTVLSLPPRPNKIEEKPEKRKFISFTWSLNPEPSIVKYAIYMRMEGEKFDYAKPVWVGAGRTTKVGVLNIDSEKKYYFVIRAIDKDGMESGDSPEVEVIGSIFKSD